MAEKEPQYLRITVEGKHYTIEDLTIDECAWIQDQTDRNWWALQPMGSAAQCKAVLTVLYARTRGREESAALVGAMSFKAADGHFTLITGRSDDRPTEHEDGKPVVDPKAEPAASATT